MLIMFMFGHRIPRSESFLHFFLSVLIVEWLSTPSMIGTVAVGLIFTAAIAEGKHQSAGEHFCTIQI